MDELNDEDDVAIDHDGVLGYVRTGNGEDEQVCKQKIVDWAQVLGRSVIKIYTDEPNSDFRGGTTLGGITQVLDVAEAHAHRRDHMIEAVVVVDEQHLKIPCWSVAAGSKLREFDIPTWIVGRTQVAPREHSFTGASCGYKATFEIMPRSASRSGPPPYGYRRARDASGNSCLLPLDAEAPVVELILTSYADGMAPVDLAKMLCGLRVPTRTGRTWTSSGVMQVLLSGSRVGHESIVGSELALEVAARLGERTRRLA